MGKVSILALVGTAGVPVDIVRPFIENIQRECIHNNVIFDTAVKDNTSTCGEVRMKNFQDEIKKAFGRAKTNPQPTVIFIGCNNGDGYERKSWETALQQTDVKEYHKIVYIKLIPDGKIKDRAMLDKTKKASNQAVEIRKMRTQSNSNDDTITLTTQWKHLVKWINVPINLNERVKMDVIVREIVELYATNCPNVYNGAWDDDPQRKAITRVPDNWDDDPPGTGSVINDGQTHDLIKNVVTDVLCALRNAGIDPRYT